MAEIDKDRGTGRTTKQLQDASPNAVFICDDGETYYVRALALKLKRLDIHVRPAHALETGELRGVTCEVILDHAVRLTDPQRAAWKRLSPTFHRDRKVDATLSVASDNLRGA